MGNYAIVTATMLRTKKQEEKICGACPIAKTANLVGDTFTLLIIRDLLTDPRRFSDLQSSLSGVSTRTIVKKLKHLENQGVIKRKALSERPPHVEYSLTKNGKALYKIVESMREYGGKYL